MRCPTVLHASTPLSLCINATFLQASYLVCAGAWLVYCLHEMCQVFLLSDAWPMTLRCQADGRHAMRTDVALVKLSGLRCTGCQLEGCRGDWQGLFRHSLGHKQPTLSKHRSQESASPDAEGRSRAPVAAATPQHSACVCLPGQL